MQKYEELKRLLGKLFQKLYFPIGGEIDDIQAIWMKFNEKYALTMVTKKGYVTIDNNGEMIHQTESLEMVESFYLNYFRY